ncbi:jg462, partial [Pararge aegeria aegeria]
VPADVIRVPLLLLHGWGGSFREFYDAIALLTTPTDGIAFEIIVPSLPGFGFSDAAVRPGMGPTQMGVVLRNLMNRLGFNQFYIQGGDWGSVVGTAIATMYQDEVLGFHTNLNFVLNSCTEITTAAGAIAAVLGVQGSELSSTIIEESGYFHLQATKPDTLGK